MYNVTRAKAVLKELIQVTKSDTALNHEPIAASANSVQDPEGAEGHDDQTESETDLEEEEYPRFIYLDPEPASASNKEDSRDEKQRSKTD